MKINHLVTFTPLAPFFFGGERTFGYSNEGDQSEGNYLIRSECYPQQTTLLGTIRKIMIEHIAQVPLKKNFSYSIEEKNRIDAAIGREGFQFDELNLETTRNYGKILSISPLMLTDHSAKEFWFPEAIDETLAPEPSSMQIRRLDKSVIQPSYIQLKGYNPKKGLAYSWRSISGSLNENDIFSSSEQVGIDRIKHGEPMNPDNQRFYRQFFNQFSPDTSVQAFAVIMELDHHDALTASGTVTMGGRMSPFSYLIQPVDSSYFDLWQASGALESSMKINQQLAESKIQRIVTLSDLYLPHHVLKEHVSQWIAEPKPFRYLSNDRKISGYRRSEKQYMFVKRGSVFYSINKEVFLEKIYQLDSLRQIGFNYTI